MRLLITGGAGFIGSNFIRYLLDKHPDYKVINLDNLTYAGNLGNLEDVQKNKNYSFVKGDICNNSLLKRLTAKCDIIVNFAAATHVDRSIKDASEFVRTNVFGTYSLLEAACKSRVKLFLQISTDEVYGSIIKGKSTENSLLAPNSPYAASKAAGDHLVRSYYVTYKLPCIVSRSSNNFGPFQYPEKIIPLFITNLLLNKKVPLYGDGLNERDWIFVLDNCSAIERVIHKGKIGEIYNIGRANEKKNIELTEKILKLMGRPKSYIQYVTDRPGHDRRYALNCAKIKKLGWQPEYSFDEGLRLTVQWYRENRDWWKKLKYG